MPRLGLIQHSARHDKEQTIAHAVDMVKEAAADGCQIICLPELFFTPFRVMDLDYSFFDVAEPIPGPTTDRMSDLAAELGVVMVVPIYEAVDQTVYYNSAVLIDDDGAIKGKYRKQHIPLTTSFYEKLYFKPGNLGYPVFETSVGRIGMYICHDRHYPEGMRALALAGAELILIPVATPTASPSGPVFELEIRAHAVFNELFVAGVNRVGTEGKFTYYGRSLIAAPDGEIIAQAKGDEEGIVAADLDYSLIRERRLKWQFYRERRPHTYGALVEEQP